MEKKNRNIISPNKYFKIANTIKNTTKKLANNSSHHISGPSNNRSTTRLNSGEHHFKIIHELLRAKLREAAPVFYRHYRRKLLDKVINEGKSMTKPASPGKFRTLKGQPAMPKYPTRLALIRDAYLSDKSPIKMYDWWSQKLDDYGMAAENWHFTWPEIECGFYNQITHLSNSFNKYPPLEDEEGAREQELLTEYLSLVEQIVQSCQQKSDEQPNYMLMMDAQMAYVRITQMRHTGKDDCAYLDYFKDVLEKTKQKPIILWAISTNPSEANFAKYYSVPLIPFLSVYKLVHSYEHLAPCNQIEHDIKSHSKNYINLDLLNYSTISDFKKEFLRRTLIIEAIISETNYLPNSRHIDRPDLYQPEIKLIDVFFDDIHEGKYFDVKTIYFNSYANLNWPEQIEKIASNIFDRYDRPGKYFEMPELYKRYVLRVSSLIHEIH